MKVTVIVKPGSKKGPLVESDGAGNLLIYVRERAIDDKANNATNELLSKHFQVPKTRVRLVSGASSKHKVFQID